MDELRDEIYGWSLNLVKNGFRLEAIFLFLSTWNIAAFRYAMRRFRIEEFKRALESCDFEFFRSRKFESTDLMDTEVVKKTEEIYEALSRFDGVKHVGASKVMHLLNPEFFMMWDSKVINHYEAKRTPEGYVDFMRLMQKMWKEGKFPKPRKGETVTRAIDVYNITVVPDRKGESQQQAPRPTLEQSEG